MKRSHFYIASAVFISALAACNGASNSNTGSTDSLHINPGDSVVSSTTTTTVTHHRYAGNFTPHPDVKYLDLRTNKKVSVRIDTVRGQVVNQETDEPLELFVDPVKHDTIYGQTGSVVNNYVIKDENGGYRVDTVRINTVEVHTVAATPAAEAAEPGMYKEKDKRNKVKIKTDDEKIKEKNGVIKVKDR